MKKYQMNRRAIFRVLGGACLSLPMLDVTAKKKKKGKDKDKKEKIKNVVLKGEIVLVKDSSNNIYKILTDKGAFTFSKAVEGKVKELEGSIVTVYAKVDKDRVNIIEAVAK